MKHRCKLGLVPAVLTLLCFSAPVMAREQVPFRGTLTGFARPTVVDPCTIIVPISGAGQAMDLGRFTWSSTSIATEICTLFPSFNIHETVTLTAANGDQLFGTGVGTGTTVDFTDPSKIQVTVEETITITGGTGR